MDDTNLKPSLIEIKPLTIDGFLPYGWVLGRATPLDDGILAFSNADTAFLEEHVFDPGIHGESQILWVIYRQRRREVHSLEVHRLCEQAVVPLTGEIIQIVATSQNDGSLDTSSLTAFRIPTGEGICMRPGCWHTTRIGAQEVKCVMFTRRSTTIDLVAHLTGGSPLSESSITLVDKMLSA